MSFRACRALPRSDFSAIWAKIKNINANIPLKKPLKKPPKKPPNLQFLIVKVPSPGGPGIGAPRDLRNPHGTLQGSPPTPQGPPVDPPGTPQGIQINARKANQNGTQIKWNPANTNIITDLWCATCSNAMKSRTQCQHTSCLTKTHVSVVMFCLFFVAEMAGKCN